MAISPFVPNKTGNYENIKSGKGNIKLTISRLGRNKILKINNATMLHNAREQIRIYNYWDVSLYARTGRGIIKKPPVRVASIFWH